MNVNKTLLAGNLTRDAELRYIPNGSAVCELRIASTRKYRTQAGVDREETLYLDAVIWGKRGESLVQYLKKGKNVFLEGHLKLDQWEHDGRKHSKVTLVVADIQLLGSRSETQSPKPAPAQKPAPAPAKRAEPKPVPVPAFDDSEIPF